MKGKTIEYSLIIPILNSYDYDLCPNNIGLKRFDKECRWDMCGKCWEHAFDLLKKGSENT